MDSLEYFIGNCWVEERDEDYYDGSWVSGMNYLARAVMTTYIHPEDDASFMERSGSWYVDYDEAIRLLVKRRL